MLLQTNVVLVLRGTFDSYHADESSGVATHHALITSRNAIQPFLRAADGTLAPWNCNGAWFDEALGFHQLLCLGNFLLRLRHILAGSVQELFARFHTGGSALVDGLSSTPPSTRAPSRLVPRRLRSRLPTWRSIAGTDTFTSGGRTLGCEWTGG